MNNWHFLSWKLVLFIKIKNYLTVNNYTIRSGCRFGRCIKQAKNTVTWLFGLFSRILNSDLILHNFAIMTIPGLFVLKQVFNWLKKKKKNIYFSLWNTLQLNWEIIIKIIDKLIYLYLQKLFEDDI